MAVKSGVEPFEFVRAHLGIDRSVLSKVSTEKTPVVGL